MQTLRFTQATDVWSFGITVLEIYTDGARPYTDLTNIEVINKVMVGYRAPRPISCEPEVFVGRSGMLVRRPWPKKFRHEIETVELRRLL